jgi:membrane protease subunit HflC
VHVYDARIQTMDAEPELYLTVEKKNLVVDSFVKWRISDVSRYYVTVGGLASNARSRLAQLVNDGLRTEFGKRTVKEVVSGERAVIMDILRENTNKEADEYGIEVVDVRLQRVDLVPEISQSVYNRMEAERARVAKERRAQGAEAAEKIRAEAERQRDIILAEAYRDAQRVRGEGDATATGVYADAYGQDAEFYSLYRSLLAYKEAFKENRDFLVLEPDSDFFKYFTKPEKR